MASLPSDEEKDTVELAVLTKDNTSLTPTSSEGEGGKTTSDKGVEHAEELDVVPPGGLDPLAVETTLPVYRLYKRR